MLYRTEYVSVIKTTLLDLIHLRCQPTSKPHFFPICESKHTTTRMTGGMIEWLEESPNLRKHQDSQLHTWRQIQGVVSQGLRPGGQAAFGGIPFGIAGIGMRISLGKKNGATTIGEEHHSVSLVKLFFTWSLLGSVIAWVPYYCFRFSHVECRALGRVFGGVQFNWRDRPVNPSGDCSKQAQKS